MSAGGIERTTVVDLLRHGETSNPGCLSGQVDVPVTDTGRQQMEHALARAQPYHRVISSPLQRCRLFAGRYSQNRGLDLTVNPVWQEMNFGEWDGCSYEQLHATAPQALADFWRDPQAFPPPGAEPLDAFRQRIASAWEQLLAQHTGERLLLVTHGGVIRQLLSLLLDMSPNVAMTRLHIPYASVTRIEVWHDAQGQQWPRLIFTGTLP